MSDAAGGQRENAYPVTFDVEPQLVDRNRVTVGFRFILAIPQILLAGSPGGMGLPAGVNPGGFPSPSGVGALGAAAFAAALVSWFAIIFTGKHPRGLWDFAALYMRWRATAI